MSTEKKIYAILKLLIIIMVILTTILSVVALIKFGGLNSTLADLEEMVNVLKYRI